MQTATTTTLRPTPPSPKGKRAVDVHQSTSTNKIYTIPIWPGKKKKFVLCNQNEMSCNTHTPPRVHPFPYSKCQTKLMMIWWFRGRMNILLRTFCFCLALVISSACCLLAHPPPTQKICTPAFCQYLTNYFSFTIRMSLDLVHPKKTEICHFYWRHELILLQNYTIGVRCGFSFHSNINFWIINFVWVLELSPSVHSIFKWALQFIIELFYEYIQQ